jgi:poly-gamma-glutamate synthesis protein (capsule biosynthesis protein)
MSSASTRARASGAERAVEVFFGGDVMTDRGVDPIMAHPSDPIIFEGWLRDARVYVALAEEVNGPIPAPVGPEYVWGDALADLRRADVCVVNLEMSVTTSDDARPAKGIHYRMHPENVGCLTAAGIDVWVLANNHLLDWGRAGLVETIETLRRAGIRTVGAGRDDAEAESVVAVEIPGGGRLLVVAWADPSSGVPPSWRAGPGRPGVALLEKLDEAEADAIAERVAQARRPGDVVVASLHWGSNWGYEVEDDFVRFAHALVDRGVDVVHGHSSHHPRPVEYRGGRLILYGTGDFLTDYEGIRGYEAFRNELVLGCFVRIEDGRLELRAKPFRLGRMRLERASPRDAAWLTGTLARISEPFGTAVDLVAGDIVAIPEGRSGR